MAKGQKAQDSLTDGVLQSEIEMVGDLVVAATSSDGPLPQSEIDRLLGVAAGDQVEATHEADAGNEVEPTDEVDVGDEVKAAKEVEAAEEKTPDAGS